MGQTSKSDEDKEKKIALSCIIPLSASLHCRSGFSYSSVAQMQSKCFTSKTKFLHGHKLSELAASMGVGV